MCRVPLLHSEARNDLENGTSAETEEATEHKITYQRLKKGVREYFSQIHVFKVFRFRDSGTKQTGGLRAAPANCLYRCGGAAASCPARS